MQDVSKGSHTTSVAATAAALSLILTIVAAPLRSAGSSRSVRATVIEEVAKLESSGQAAGDGLGAGVAVAGEAIAVGAPGEDQGFYARGAAYVFTEPPGGWTGEVTESATLLPTNPADFDRFGHAVAADNDVVVVAASYADPNGDDSGAVYVFVKPPGGWAGTLTESARLLPADGAAGDNFGCSVAIEGETIVVGSRYDDDQGSNSGSVYVFLEPTGGWSSIVHHSAKLTASNGAVDDNLGTAVSISGDVIVAGAQRHDHWGIDSGAAYVFEKPAGGWAGSLAHDAMLVPSDGAIIDNFGDALVVVGDCVLVGSKGNDHLGDDSGSAYWFVKPMGGWTGVLGEVAKLIADDGGPTDRFGNAVAASKQGVVIGAPFDNDYGYQAGSAYAAARSRLGWMGTVVVDLKLVPTDLTEYDTLGRPVAIMGDMIIVGSSAHECAAGHGCGAAYLFHAPWLFADGFETGDTTFWSASAP